MAGTRPDDRMLAQWLRLSLASRHQAVHEPLPQGLAELLQPASDAVR